ncbi:hypothetical protein GUITHDRAFT_153346 [Guillardia theta CCMP2712]|uniref:SAM domain-containing protein n=1 Tax=Guillardia theta (strain CCMP2712) TaxID=905079 RepID=L1J4M5_GUITC|nr:hypothetical protein GUITHDRAFT_153346 [Guillardia theta CCMP2712]EKX43079.1 hypothetical protein GUITHDRAFT_153346 [Guillardia theta CCMP2712]|eukprot:XP_005830059.1 hypothetical protein GUITHDRAFT_153346 [Guillardia theta CCMP2712]
MDAYKTPRDTRSVVSTPGRSTRKIRTPPPPPTPVSATKQREAVGGDGEWAVVGWLGELGLGQYAPAFLEHGWDSLEAVAAMGEDDLLIMGVKAGHARKIFRRLSMLPGAKGGKGGGGE